MLLRHRAARLAAMLFAVALPALTQRGQRPLEGAGVAVRFVEGTVHGFVELRTA